MTAASFTAAQVVEQLRALLGDWHPALATTVHNAKTTPTTRSPISRTPTDPTGPTSTEAQP
ncbi:hypothetical protein ACL02T_22110 [Pseudonocardia sp. RS010]|uniref:hypothetical protein n=1 Tax=Pseudonocardia sp. RS010 TaxID=3385979 RepID=UPI0039A0A799